MAEAKKKRRIKNPETFRERAQKQTEAAKPAKKSRIAAAAGKVTTPVSHNVSRFFDLKPMRPVRKVLKFIGKIIFPAYFRNSWRELKQVAWPSWKESRRLTFAVLVFAIVFGAAIAGVDWGLDKIFKQLLLK